MTDRVVLATVLRSLADEMGVHFVDGLEMGEFATDDFRFWRLRPGYVTPDYAVLEGDLLKCPPAAVVAAAKFEIKRLLRGPDDSATRRS